MRVLRRSWPPPDKRHRAATPLQRTMQLTLEAGSVVLAGTAVATAAIAFREYRRAAVQRRARWLSDLHDRFYTSKTYETVREALDGPFRSQAIRDAEEGHDAGLVVYLNFFQFIAHLVNTGALGRADAEAMFRYYLTDLARDDVRRYLQENGFTILVRFLKDYGQTPSSA